MNYVYRNNGRASHLNERYHAPPNDWDHDELTWDRREAEARRRAILGATLAVIVGAMAALFWICWP